MTTGQDRLAALWRRGTDFLGCEHAILGGAMTWVSERNLVAATSNAGGFGVIACGAMDPEMLKNEIEETRKLTDKPFGVNVITLHPQFSELIDACGSAGASHIVLAGGIPPADNIRQAKDYGAKVICFAPALVLAKKLIRSGADALVIEGSEAGGHIGPVSTAVLAQEMLPIIHDVPVFVAGGVGRGEAIATYLQMGASGIQIGTRLVCAEESIAHEDFKKAFVRAPARDSVASVQIDPNFPVIPVRALKNKGTEEFMETQRQVVADFHAGKVNQDDAQMRIERFWAGALRRAVIEGDVETGSLMAGQSVGMVKRVEPARDIIQELVDQAAAQLERRVA